MHYIIVSDSSSNIFSIPGADYRTVPMKVIAEKEYLDVPGLDVAGMVHDLKRFKGKSGSSCPNVQEWLDAFEGADCVFCATISRNLSGSYNSAKQAMETWLEENPGKRGYVFDTLTAGPEQAMLCEKIAQRGKKIRFTFCRDHKDAFLLLSAVYASRLDFSFGGKTELVLTLEEKKSPLVQCTDFLCHLKGFCRQNS